MFDRKGQVQITVDVGFDTLMASTPDDVDGILVQIADFLTDVIENAKPNSFVVDSATVDAWGEV